MGLNQSLLGLISPIMHTSFAFLPYLKNRTTNLNYYLSTLIQ